MYDHECNPLKGWFHMHALDKSAPLASGETIYAGRVVYLDASGNVRMGLPDNCMPMFAWPNSYDYDVDGDVGNIQSQVMMALPVTGPYELQTTEYDTAYTYHPNDHLTAWDSHLGGYSVLNKGKVRKGWPYHETICGVISTGAAVNDHGKSWVSLWTYYLPVDLGAS
jgi:hypothetical protein